MIFLIITSLIWAFSYGLVKENLTDLNSSFVAWARVLLALPVFLPFFRFRSLSMRLSIHLFIIGMIQYGLLYTCYIKAFQYLDGYQVALFTIFMPIYVTLFDDIYQRKMKWDNLGTAILAVLGAAIIEYEKGVSLKHLMFGFILMQISNLSFAWGQIEYKRLREIHKELNDKQVYALLFLGAFVLTTFTTTLANGWVSVFDLTRVHLITLIFLGTIATGLGCFLWNVGAIKTHAGALAVMNNIKIPLAVLVSLTIFGEETHILRLIIGGSVMVFAVLLSEYFRNKSMQLQILPNENEIPSNEKLESIEKQE